MSARNVHLVGSVPMADAEEVFETVSAALGTRIKRIPDGETGERGDWITWLEPVFADNPAFAEVGRILPRPRERHRARALHAARRRRAAGRALRQSVLCGYRQGFLCGVQAAEGGGKNPRRHQVPGRSGAGALGHLAVPGRSRCTRRSIRSTTTRSSARSTRSPPPSRMTSWRSSSTWPRRCSRGSSATRRRATARGKAEMQETFSNILVDLGNRVPADIDLLYHLCYGDSNHRHVVEPTDMGDMVEFANRVSRRIERPVQLIHMPVPRNRSDDAYFEPLRRLALRPETELCLGLVHHTDGVDGTQAAACDRARSTSRVLHRDRMRLRPARSRRRSRSCCASTRRWRTNPRPKPPWPPGTRAARRSRRISPCRARARPRSTRRCRACRPCRRSRPT